jgi:hypothetical protein
LQRTFALHPDRHHVTHDQDDDTRRAIDKLAGLVRLQERAEAENRPAMVHACQLLIGLEIGSLKALAKPGGATPGASDGGAAERGPTG